MSPLSYLQHAPNTLLLFGLLGVLLIYLELNRPGLVLPGTAGLTIVLVCSAALSHLPWRFSGIFLLLAAATVQLLSLRRQLHWSTELAAGLAAYFGCRYLLSGTDGESQISIVVAASVAIVLGPGTSMLTALARRARRNKGLDS